MELGSEYNLSLSELSVKNNNIFDYLSRFNTVFTSSGRGAIGLIAEKFKSVLIPEFICESVIERFNKSKIVFYKINKDCTIDTDDLLEKISTDIDGVFIMHYFGAIQPSKTLERIKSACDKFNVKIIEDTTHSIFSAKSTIGDYMIASVRKWFPIPNGGVLYSKEDLSGYDLPLSTDNLKVSAMVLKDLYLNSGYDYNDDYRNIFIECERRLDDDPKPKLISDLSRFILSCFDVGVLIEKRKTNYKYLSNKLSELGLLPTVKLGDGCPFVLPLRVNNRDEFRKYLINNKVYCAVHWPKDEYFPSARQTALLNAQTLISLPIDQRYGVDDMDYLLKTISSFGGDLKF